MTSYHVVTNHKRDLEVEELLKLFGYTALDDLSDAHVWLGIRVNTHDKSFLYSNIGNSISKEELMDCLIENEEMGK